MYVVSATLLVTSVFFLSTLVIRFRFNEAYKYAEEILSVARILNEKESTSDIRLKDLITTEIDKTLVQAQAALDDLKPLGNAMKGFRNVGVFFFISSVSMCGLYYHWTAAVSLFCVVISAYVVTYVDSSRRKTRFLPALESIAMSIWHRKKF